MALPVDDVPGSLVIARELLSEAVGRINAMRQRCRCYSLMTKCRTCSEALETEHRIYALLDGSLKFL